MYMYAIALATCTSPVHVHCTCKLLLKWSLGVSSTYSNLDLVLSSSALGSFCLAIFFAEGRKGLYSSEVRVYYMLMVYCLSLLHAVECRWNSTVVDALTSNTLE